MLTLLTGGALGLLLTFLFLPRMLNLLTSGGATRPNYRGKPIPVGMGLLFAAVYLLTALLLFNRFGGIRGAGMMLGIIFLAFLGLIDDLLGSRESRGLLGHFKALIKEGRLTTGAVKALGGGVVSLVVALLTMPGRSWWELITAALLIALGANTINLLDLRPGRAVKAFLLWGILLGLGTSAGGTYFLLMPLLGSVLAYARADLRAEAMLGDAGANPLGAALGMVTAWNVSWTVQLALVALLLLLHIATERFSLTELIEKNRAASFLDQLGRVKDKEREVLTEIGKDPDQSGANDR